jgi:predicted esterase
MMILVPATVHGRVFIEPDEHAAVSLPRHGGEAAKAGSGALVGFHGYAQTGTDMMDELGRIPGADSWKRVSIQALNRFYIRGNEKIVSSWMTREDREQAIADNIAYVDAALEHLAPSTKHTQHQALSTQHGTLVFAGFSQGVAMAYRAALMGARPAAGIIALAGDIPPEVKSDAPGRHPWPKVLIGVGDKEQWYTGAKLDDDLAFLNARGINHSLVRFKGGHEWTDEFRSAAGDFLAALQLGN